MKHKEEKYIHLTENPADPGTSAGRFKRIRARTFLAPLIFMLLHHAVLNGISLVRTFSYLLANPALQAELQEKPNDGAVMMRILVESDAIVYASLFGMVILIPAYLFYLHRRRKKQDLPFVLERVNWIQSLSAVAVVLGALGLTQLWMAILASFDPSSALGRLFADYMEKMILFDAATSVSALDFIATVLLVPVGEELLFRGIIQGELRRAFSPAVSVVGTTVLFALFHLDLIQGSYVLIAGLALSLAYHLTRNMAIPIGMHAIFNFIGSGWLIRLTGAGEQAEEMIVYTLYAFILIGLAGMLILRNISRKQEKATV